MGDIQLDQGWSWVVDFASFFSQTMLSSCYYAYGVFLQPWMERYDISSATASIVGATASGLISMIAPFSSYLVNRLGCRKTMILGGILSTFGLLIASRANSFILLLFSYGIISGIGFGLAYVPSVVVLSEYFKAKRGIALGIACSGIGVGSFLFPLLLEKLMNYYGLDGAMLILAGLIFNNCVCGMVMFPIKNNTKTKLKSKQDIANPKLQIDCNHNFEEIKNNYDNVFTTKIDGCKIYLDNNNLKSKTNCNDSYIRTVENCDEVLPLNNKSTLQPKQSFLRHPWLRRKSSLFRLGIQNNNNSASNTISIVEFKPQDRTKSEIANEKEPPTESILSLQSTFASQSRAIIRHPLFYAMIISNVTMYTNMMMTYCLVPICAVTELGFTKDEGALLVSLVGLTTMIGRFGWGIFITIFPQIKPIYLFIVLRMLAAILTLLNPLAVTFLLQVIYCTLVGLCFGCWSIYPVVVSFAFGDSRLNVAFGYLETFNGIGSLIGPILGGYLYILTGSYKTSFIVSGILQATGTLTTALAFKFFYSRCAENSRKR